MSHSRCANFADWSRRSFEKLMISRILRTSPLMEVAGMKYFPFSLEKERHSLLPSFSSLSVWPFRMNIGVFAVILRWMVPERASENGTSCET